MSNDLTGIKQNTVKLAKKQLGEHILSFTGMDSEVSGIQFNATTDYNFNLKECSILIQHNLPQLGYNNHSIVVYGYTHNSYVSNEVTLSQFNCTNYYNGLNTCLTQVKLCGNISCQCFEGTPTKLNPKSTMWGGWVQLSKYPNASIPEGLNFNTVSDVTVNHIAANRTQCEDSIKGIRIYLQNSDGYLVNIPSNCYFYVDIYGIKY